MLAEEYLYSQIEKATRGDRLHKEERERKILERGADRSVRIPAPAVAEPTGRFSTVSEAMAAFAAARATTVRFVEHCPDDLRALFTSHPLIGPVNCHEMLLIMAIHPRRHVHQIEENKSALARH